MKNLACVLLAMTVLTAQSSTYGEDLDPPLLLWKGCKTYRVFYSSQTDFYHTNIYEEGSFKACDPVINSVTLLSVTWILFLIPPVVVLQKFGL